MGGWEAVPAQGRRRIPGNKGGGGARRTVDPDVCNARWGKSRGQGCQGRSRENRPGSFATAAPKRSPGFPTDIGAANARACSGSPATDRNRVGRYLRVQWETRALTLGRPVEDWQKGRELTVSRRQRARLRWGNTYFRGFPRLLVFCFLFLVFFFLAVPAVPSSLPRRSQPSFLVCYTRQGRGSAQRQGCCSVGPEQWLLASFSGAGGVPREGGGDERHMRESSAWERVGASREFGRGERLGVVERG